MLINVYAFIKDFSVVMLQERFYGFNIMYADMICFSYNDGYLVFFINALNTVTHYIICKAKKTWIT